MIWSASRSKALEGDTHFFGTLAVTRAFAPQLAAHGRGAWP
jgi:hypothetical protein